MAFVGAEKFSEFYITLSSNYFFLMLTVVTVVSALEISLLWLLVLVPDSAPIRLKARYFEKPL